MEPALTYAVTMAEMFSEMPADHKAGIFLQTHQIHSYSTFTRKNRNKQKVYSSPFWEEQCLKSF